jgi:glycerol uptake facilitator-like aquaporin
MPSSGCAAWFYPRASLNDLRSPVFWRDVFAELLAVTILMTMVALVVISNNEEHYKITTTHLGLFALVLVYLLIEGFGPINGTHLNPTGSVSLFIAGKISFARGKNFLTYAIYERRILNK